MLDHLRRERESETLQQALVQADAPLELMQALFGTGAHEYTRLRRMLTINPTCGRTPEADEAQSAALWEAWKHCEPAPTLALTPTLYLSLHQATGISLRIIWNLIQRWRTYGAADESGPRRMPADGLRVPD